MPDRLDEIEHYLATEYKSPLNFEDGGWLVAAVKRLRIADKDLRSMLQIAAPVALSLYEKAEN